YCWHYENTISQAAQWKHLASGLYYLKARDSNFCIDSLMILVPSPQILSLEIESQNCSYGGSQQLQADSLYQNGSIHVQVHGGTPPFRYQWADGDTNSQRLNLPPAVYLLTVSDAHNNKIAQLIEIKRPDFLRAQILLDKIPNCAGEYNGSLRAEVQGGIPPYRYTWYMQKIIDKDTLFDAIGSKDSLQKIKSGYYKLQVLDSMNRQTTYIYFLQDAPTLQVQSTRYSPLCHGAHNGKIILHAQGGFAPYTYQWISFSEGAILSDIQAGSYVFQVRDAKNCFFTDTINLTEPSKLEIQKQSISPLCHEDAQGKIIVHAQGGTAPYQYQWKNFEADSILDSVKAGKYLLKLVDSNQCMYEEEIEIKAPAPLKVYTKIKPVLCYGGQEASITLYVEGGVKPYRYQWGEGQTTASIDSVKYGFYNLQITDFNQCILLDTIFVGQPSPLSAKIEKQNLSCFGSNDGGISLRTLGGTFPYSYSWNTGDTLSYISNLEAALYRFKVKDAKACEYEDSVYIQQPDSLGAKLNIHAHTYTGNRAFVAGVQNSDAKIFIKMQGGRVPYSYRWSSGETADSICQKSHGTYSVYVSDSSNCQWIQEFKIKETPALQARIELVQAVQCYADSNASLKANIQGGTPPYQIRWNIGDTTLSIDSLKKSLYVLYAKDSLGVEALDSLYVSEPKQPKLAYIKDSALCFGQSNASLEVQIEGATFPYELQWSTGQKTNKISNIAAGTYFLHIVDKNQCVYTDSVVLEDRPKVQIGLDIIEVSCADKKGQIQVSAKGGVAPYYFNWKDPLLNAEKAQFTFFIEKAEAGPYQLQVKDQNHCIADTQFILKVPPILDVKLIDSQTFCVDKYVELNPIIQYLPQAYSYMQNEWMRQYADSLIYIWTLPNGEMVFAKEIQAHTKGMYHLMIMEYGGCVHLDSTYVSASQDSISSDFWISTQVYKDELILAVNVSHPQADSVHWIVPQSVQILKTEGEYAELKFTEVGTHEIVLHSYKDHCFESKHTFVNVSEKPTNYGKKQSAAKTIFEKISVSPNPSSGISTLHLVFKESSELNCRLIEAASGKIVYANQFQIEKGQEFVHYFGAELFAKTLYLLVLESKHEVKIIKIVRN
ncbi:MAG: SprB repeat-containing protein, partial [Bacteroidales bacterium]